MQGLFLVVFSIAVIILYWHQSESYVPKKIWTYWDNPDTIPKMVQKCMARWVKWNPHDHIVLLTRKNYKGYVTIPPEISGHPIFQDPVDIVDLIRIWTLAEHGGIWMDSTTILNAPLSWVFPWYCPQNKEYSGFYMESYTTISRYPVIENGFMACIKGSPFVKLWRDELSQLARYPSVEVYVTSRARMGVNLQNIPHPLEHLMHVAAQKVLQMDQYPLDRLLLRNAEDGSILNSYRGFFSFSRYAPFEYMVTAQWNEEKAVEQLRRFYPIMIVRETEQKIIEQRDEIMMIL